MYSFSDFSAWIDAILFVSSLFLLLGSVFLSFKMRFIQLRFFPIFIKVVKESFLGKKDNNESTISPMKALMTAMSTTLGIGTIAAPAVAIHMGGPGALLGFVLTAFLGSAATFTEVNLGIRYRKTLPSGAISGGPMHYLSAILSPTFAKWYALGCCILMTAWSAAQTNQLAAILDSPLLGDYRIPVVATSAVIALLVIVTLTGGINRLSSVSAKMVPVMFCLYVGCGLWIVFSDLSKLASTLSLIASSAFTPYAMTSGSLVGGIVSALRWGIFKGTQVTEAGVGTQAIPHSMANTSDPTTQGMLAMISTFTGGLLAFLSGCIVLMTETWQDPTLPMGISMVAASFQQYFSSFGVLIIGICAILFALGTVFGNSYNGSQCFGYMTQNKKNRFYYAMTALVILGSAVFDVKTVWSVIDLFLAGIAIPHMIGLMVYAQKNSLEITPDLI